MGMRTSVPKRVKCMERDETRAIVIERRDNNTGKGKTRGIIKERITWADWLFRVRRSWARNILTRRDLKDSS
jgi:hypothetical protein